MYVAYSARQDFLDFVRSHDVKGMRASSERGNTQLLQEYLCEWLRCGKGIEVTGADFAIFLQTVILIVQAWLDDPSILNLHYEEDGERKVFERAITGVYRLFVHPDCTEQDVYACVLYRDYYETLAKLAPAQRATFS